MKVGVAIYYKNIEQYPERWIKKCIDSIYNQTYKDYHIYKLDYGQELSDIDFVDKHRLIADWKPLPNYAAAMNYIYSWIFETCDVAVNVNIDDFYDPRRIELLLKQIESGVDVASSNYHIIDVEDNIIFSTNWHKDNIYKTLKSGINPVSNPAHVMHKRVFEKLQFDPSLVPYEDMDYWKKVIKAGFKIKIVPEYLHYYRMHSRQAQRVCNEEKNNALTGEELEINL